MDREIEFLNAPTAEQRLENLKTLLAEEKEKPAVLPQYANNHIHTTFSFSPDSPRAPGFAARRSIWKGMLGIFARSRSSRSQGDS